MNKYTELVAKAPKYLVEAFDQTRFEKDGEAKYIPLVHCEKEYSRISRKEGLILVIMCSFVIICFLGLVLLGIGFGENMTILKDLGRIMSGCGFLLAVVSLFTYQVMGESSSHAIWPLEAFERWLKELNPTSAEINFDALTYTALLNRLDKLCKRQLQLEAEFEVFTQERNFDALAESVQTIRSHRNLCNRVWDAAKEYGVVLPSKKRVFDWVKAEMST